MTNIKFKVILKIFFIKFNNGYILFNDKIFIKKSYITNKTLPTIEQVYIVNPKKFILVVLNADIEIFVIYVAIQN